jgi:hypothetical protein
MNVDGYVDAAGIGRRLFILPGEVFVVYLNKEEVSRSHSSCSNEPCLKGNNTEASQNSEGLNIKLFQMLHGVNLQPCIKRNRETEK